MTTAQLQALKAAINADGTLNTFPVNSDGSFAIAQLLNADASPDYWVWKSGVTRAEIYNLTSPDASTWSWTTYKNQSVTEQNAWVQMFMGDQADFSKANLRAGVAAIFTGSAQANAQRDHCLSMGRRKATRGEKILAVATSGGVGTRGSTANPDTPGFEGQFNYHDIDAARNS